MAFSTFRRASSKSLLFLQSKQVISHQSVTLSKSSLQQPTQVFSNTAVLGAQKRLFSSEAAKVSIESIKELRKRTLAGYNDCRNALAAENGDLEKAIEWLKKKGAMKAASKANRVAAEGLIGVATNSTNNVGVLVEVNSETDFVSRGDLFSKLTKDVTVSTLNKVKATDSAAVFSQSVDPTQIKENTSVGNLLTDVAAKLGENIQFRRALQLGVPQGKGVVSSYVHRQQGDASNGASHGQIASLVALESEAASSSEKAADLLDFGRKLAMHIVGYNPKFITREEVTKEVLDLHEKDFLKQQEEDKMADKKKKFHPESVMGDIVLMEQEYTLDNSKKVKEIVKEQSKKIGAPIKISAFAKFVVGEGVEKKEDDFAAEVKKMTN